MALHLFRPSNPQTQAHYTYTAATDRVAPANLSLIEQAIKSKCTVGSSKPVQNQHQVQLLQGCSAEWPHDRVRNLGHFKSMQGTVDNTCCSFIFKSRVPTPDMMLQASHTCIHSTSWCPKGTHGEDQYNCCLAERYEEKAHCRCHHWRAWEER